MIASQFQAARLDKAQEQRLQAMEAALGCRLVAFKQVAKLAQLSLEQYNRLQTIEQELGVSLVAYEPTELIRSARPSEEQMKRLEALERELGFILLAFERVRTAPTASIQKEPNLASLSDTQLTDLHQLEDEMEVVLMAYKN